jgi:hypothetical protein
MLQATGGKVGERVRPKAVLHLGGEPLPGVELQGEDGANSIGFRGRGSDSSGGGLGCRADAVRHPVLNGSFHTDDRFGRLEFVR